VSGLSYPTLRLHLKGRLLRKETRRMGTAFYDP